MVSPTKKRTLFSRLSLSEPTITYKSLFLYKQDNLLDIFHFNKLDNWNHMDEFEVHQLHDLKPSTVERDRMSHAVVKTGQKGERRVGSSPLEFLQHEYIQDGTQRSV